MYNENNIFAKILRSEIPCDKVYEDEEVLFFKDINPIAKIHVLGIPKAKYQNLQEFTLNSDKETFSNFFKKISKVVDMLGLSKGGYRLITNSGDNGGQEVPHFHVHIIGGEPLGSKLG